MAMPSFSERCERFWEWFDAHEAELSQQFSQPGQANWEQVVQLARSGVALLSERLHFVLGGENEFSFTITGRRALFFLLPHLVATMPGRLRGKWTFHAGLPGLPGLPDDGLAISVHGVEVSLGQVLVEAAVAADGVSADLRFYAPDWQLDERQGFDAFYTLLDLSIGESLASLAINHVERSGRETPGMFPLAGLRQWMLERLYAGGLPPAPSQTYFTYQREPEGAGDAAGDGSAGGGGDTAAGGMLGGGAAAGGQPDDGPIQLDDGGDQPIAGLRPRFDIIAGKSSAHPLLVEYYNGQDDAYQDFVDMGAKPVFIFYEHGGSPEAISERNALTERIIGEVLGRSGDRRQLGLLLGAAVGLTCSYIDLLLYDERACLPRIADVMASLPYPVYGQEFRLGGVAFGLNDLAAGPDGGWRPEPGEETADPGRTR